MLKLLSILVSNIVWIILVIYRKDIYNKFHCFILTIKASFMLQHVILFVALIVTIYHIEV